MKQNNSGHIAIWVIVALVIGAIGGYFFADISGASLAGNKVSTSTAPQSSSSATPAMENTAPAGTDEWKIQNAMSAAQVSISKDATVLDWPAAEGGEFRELRKGANKWTCVPDLPTSPGNDPICVDDMAMQWFQAYMKHETPKIAQAGIGYMLQGGSDPSNTDPYATAPEPGEDWMTAPPHIMIFPSEKLDKKVYETEMNGGPWIMWADTPYQHLMVPVQ